MPAPFARVSFVIPVKNDAQRLANCLSTITGNDYPRSAVEIIVADNGSTDDTLNVARSAGARVFSWPGPRVSELRNRGATEATGDILAFIDADHEIVSGWTASAVDALAPDRVGAAGALYTPPAPGTWVQRLYGALRGRTYGQQDVAWLGSGNLAVRRTAFAAVGGFDASLEACEDVDFCQRLRAAGWRLVGDERLKSIHLGDPPTLRALFRAERWRGRDNLRVSLRGPLTAADLPSLVIPLVDLMAGLTLLLALFAWPVVGARLLPIIVANVIIIALLASLRALRMIVRSDQVSPLTIVQALVVALTYDAARAVALVTRASHHRAPRDPSAAGAPIT
jgi:glycosyl transferase family 2